MRNLFLSVAFALGIFAMTPAVDTPLQAVGLGADSAEAACSYDPCLYQEPRVIVQKVYVYVDSPPPKPRPKPKKVVKVVKKTNGDCEWVPFSHGRASQPVVFFRYKADARCQVKKSACSVCTDWINRKRGPVFGPASRTAGGIAYAVPAGTGVWVPRNNKGVIAYCDQAVGNDTYSWGVRE